MTVDITTLEAKAAKAQAALQVALDAAQAAREEEQARQDARDRQLAEQIVAAYNPTAMDRELREARAKFAQVFAESDIGQAWIAVQLTELRHAHASADRNGAASRLGRPDQMPARPAGNANLDHLSQIVDVAAAEAIAAELAARDADRAAYITGTED